MKREPEEDGNTQHCKQSIQTLFDFRSHSLFLLSSILYLLSSLFLGWLREFVLVDQENDQRNSHCDNRCDEREVDTLVENSNVVRAECSRVSENITVLQHSGHGLCELLSLLTVCKELVAQARHISIIDKVMRLQPPLAEERGDERGEETTNVDKDVENLETRVATFLGLFESLGAFLGGLFLELVVQFADNSLQIAFEQTVTERDEQQSHTSDSQDGGPTSTAVQNGTVSILAEQRDSHHHIADSHDNETPLDGLVVVLCSVSDDTANQTQDIDSEIEYGIDDTGRAVRQAKL